MIEALHHTARNHCLEAWICCENLLNRLADQPDRDLASLSRQADECARICMETWQALNDHQRHLQPLVLLCIGICSECADSFAATKEPQVQQCGHTCSNCAQELSSLVRAYMLH